MAGELVIIALKEPEFFKIDSIKKKRIMKE